MSGQETPLDSVQSRIRYFRTEIMGMTQAAFCTAVNPYLASGLKPSTLSNYEGEMDPRTSLVVAMRHAFPHLSLRWLLLGEGPAATWRD